MAFRKFDVAESSPLLDTLKDKEGVVKHELITYKLKDGKFIKSIHTMRYALDQTHEDSFEEPCLFSRHQKKNRKRQKVQKNQKVFQENSLTTSQIYSIITLMLIYIGDIL